MAETPRVCILMESYVPIVGGMESQTRSLVAGLRRLDVPVQIVTRRVRDDMKCVDVVDGVPVHRVGPMGQSSRLRWAMLLTSIPALFRLRREYDLIFVAGFRVLGLAAIFAGWLLRKPCVFKAECIGELSGQFFSGGFKQAKINRASLPARLFIALRNKVLRRAVAFVAMYADIADEFREHGVRDERVTILPNAVDMQRFSPADPEEKLSLRKRLGVAGAPLIAFVGRLVSYKGLPLLLRVWKDVAPQHPGAGLVIVGDGGGDMFSWEAQAHQYVRDEGMDDRVHFAGAVTNAADYLRASDIFVLPTENDALPITLIEAMACGLPIISTPVGGIGGLLAGGDTALLVPPGEDAPFREALNALLASPRLRGELGRRAEADARVRYAEDAIAGRYQDLFSHVIKTWEGR